VAGTPVSVLARAGAPKPDISSVDALKHTLLTTGSIVYADPAKGGGMSRPLLKFARQALPVE
jgi:molybdate transport system substrate-binding protein